tara:strand:+ start:63 stop:236 length:174 start_codon:yes stop_codon:yes gene_type:complete
MSKKNMSKMAKIFALISVVWLIIIYAATMTGSGKEFDIFLIIGILPLVIGWGIYIIR